MTANDRTIHQINEQNSIDSNKRIPLNYMLPTLGQAHTECGDVKASQL